MGTPRRIDMTLLDAELQALLETSLKILPVEYTVITSGVNNLGVDYVIITTPGEHRNEIYHWSGTTWELIGADDRRVDWEDVLNKPTTYAPTAHQHDDLYYERSAIDTYLAAKASNVHAHALEDVTNLVSALEGKAPIGHTHAELADHESRLSLIENGYSAGHSHDNLEQLAAITALKISIWDTVSAKADRTTLLGHTGNTTVHVTQTDKDKWNTSDITVGTVQPTNSSIWFKTL